METVFDLINLKLRHRTPSQVVFLTLGSTMVVKVAHDILADGRLSTRAQKAFWGTVRKVIEPLIQRAVRKATSFIAMPHKDGEFTARELPCKGMPEDEVLTVVRQLHDDLDVPYGEGGFSGTVYHGGAEYTRFMNAVMDIFQWSNPLHVSVFGATRKMEAEVVSMVVRMYNGHLLPDACGVVTSGGTESIMMAMRAYRGWGRAVRGLQRVSIIAPVTVHPAFDKAADYFDMDIIKVPVDPTTRRVVPAELERYIRYDTVVIVGSAPNFPYGVVDDIEQLSEIAFQHDVGMHVDCCLGGFIMPFLSLTGRKAPVVDFRNRGVTSISCDTHKYGFAPKGTSTVLYRTHALRSHQFSCVSEWPGGMYCSPSLSGSKPGNVIAGAWAAMVHFGVEGYVAACDRIVSTREYMTRELAKLPFVHILGEPTASVFAFGSDVMDIFKLGDALEEKGWVLNRLQFPSGLQFSVTWMQTEGQVAQRFVQDITTLGAALYAEEIEHVMGGNKPRTGQNSGCIYGVAQRVPDRSIILDIQREFLKAYYRA